MAEISKIKYYKDKDENNRTSKYRHIMSTRDIMKICNLYLIMN